MDKLKRELGLMDAVGIGLGAVIGAGIFVVTGVAASVAGPAFLIGLIIAGVAASCNGLSSAQLASIYPQSGGTYEYGYQVLTPWIGFSAGWMFLISKLSAGGVVAIGFGSYFGALFPVSPIAASICAVFILTIANYFGIKKAGLINLIIITITLFSLIYFIISGFRQVELIHFTPFAPNGFSGIIKSAALMFFAFTGYARITTIGEEVKNPKNTIPKAVVYTLITSIILYTLVAFIAVGTVGAKTLSNSTSPLVSAASNFNVSGVATILGIGATTAMLGVLLSQIIGISRMMFAMSRKKDLPLFLSKVHPTYHVPHMGIFICGGIILLLTIFGSIEFIVSTATFSILLYYSIANLSAIKIKNDDRFIPKWVSILGLLFCITLALSLDLTTILSCLIILLFGYLVRWIMIKTY